MASDLSHMLIFGVRSETGLSKLTQFNSREFLTTVVVFSCSNDSLPSNVWSMFLAFDSRLLNPGVAWCSPTS